nr:hypothetical protein SDDV_ORF086 [Scale drop disease virus]
MVLNNLLEKMEVDLNNSTSFPWMLLSVTGEPAITDGAVVRTVFEQTCNSMFYTNKFQTEFIRQTGAQDKFELCKTVRRNEDDHYLREQLYNCAKSKLIQHEHLLKNITVDSPDEGQREALQTAVEHAKKHFSMKRSRTFMNDREARIYYSKALALFARDELALPLHKVPHVTKSMIDRILADEPYPDTLIDIVPEEVKRNPAEVGRYLFMNHAHNRATVKLDKFKAYLLESMLHYVARKENIPSTHVQPALNILNNERIREGKDICEDLYVLWVQNKLPKDYILDESFSYHLLDPVEYLSKIDQIKFVVNPRLFNGRNRNTSSTSHTLSVNDDPDNMFYYEEISWTNIMDPALYMVCKRMDPGITVDVYMQIKQSYDGSFGKTYNTIFDANYHDKFSRNMHEFLSRKYALNPSLYILLKSALSTGKILLTCKSNNKHYNDIVVDVATHISKDLNINKALHTNNNVNELLDLSDFTTNILTNAWLTHMCTYLLDSDKTHHGFSIKSASRNPTEHEQSLFRTVGCKQRMSVSWARILSMWTHPDLLSVRTVQDFVTYLCNKYIAANLLV